MEEGKIVIVDLDQVVFFTLMRFNKILRERHPEITPVPYERTLEYETEKNYPLELRERVKSVWYEKGLFKDLPLIPGAREALEELRKRHEVLLCSSFMISPDLSPYPAYGLDDKAESVRKSLGEFWLRRLIMTKDKTPVYGDIIIDDKPQLMGLRQDCATWEHVLYDRPWNRHVMGKRRLTWQNYKQVLSELFE